MAGSRTVWGKVTLALLVATLLSTATGFVAKNAVPPLDYTGPQSGPAPVVPRRTSAGHSAQTHNYYSAFFGSAAAAQSAIQGIPGAALVGNIGELKDAFLFAIPIGQNVTETSDTTGQQLDRARKSSVPEFTPLTLKEWSKRVIVNDPGFSQQYHLTSLNVMNAWNSNINGQGVYVAVIDDGLDSTTADLSPNFYAAGSYDFLASVASPDPKQSSDTHGTRCGGLAGASANTTCGVGVAYNVRLAGIRLIGSGTTSAQEAAALNYQYQTNQVYSCSWGPADDGQTVEGFSAVSFAALQNGITNGRGGKGNVYVFASGNGGYNQDSCGYDGVSSNPFSMSIAAIDNTDVQAAFGERCAAIMVATYGVNTYTTDVGSQCASGFSGTSAATPVVSGTVALLLQSRPELTWRDVQDIYRKAAVPVDLSNTAAPWATLPSGLKYSEAYGYGKVDVSTLLSVGASHTLLGTFANQTFATISPNSAINYNVATNSSYTVNAGTSPFKVERVAVTVTLTSSNRGTLQIMLISPAGVTSYLAYPRAPDTSSAGLQAFTFYTVKHWGEQANGTWTLSVLNSVSSSDTGTLQSWNMQVYGESNSTTPATTPTPTPAPTPAADNSGSPVPVGPLVGGIAAAIVVGALFIKFCCRPNGGSQRLVSNTSSIKAEGH